MIFFLGSFFYYRPTAQDFQINAVFTHGVFWKGGLGVFYVGAGDIQRTGCDLIIPSVNERAAIALRNIVNLITLISMGMAGNGAVELFINEIQGVEIGVPNRERNIQILVSCGHGSLLIMFPTVQLLFAALLMFLIIVVNGKKIKENLR